MRAGGVERHSSDVSTGIFPRIPNSRKKDSLGAIRGHAVTSSVATMPSLPFVP